MPYFFLGDLSLSPHGGPWTTHHTIKLQNLVAIFICGNRLYHLWQLTFRSANIHCCFRGYLTSRCFPLVPSTRIVVIDQDPDVPGQPFSSPPPSPPPPPSPRHLAWWPPSATSAIRCSPSLLLS